MVVVKEKSSREWRAVALAADRMRDPRRWRTSTCAPLLRELLGGACVLPTAQISCPVLASSL
eukprot:2005637-Pleurochrysis_carterae.AAC.1